MHGKSVSPHGWESMKHVPNCTHGVYMIPWSIGRLFRSQEALELCHERTMTLLALFGVLIVLHTEANLTILVYSLDSRPS